MGIKTQSAICPAAVGDLSFGRRSEIRLGNGAPTTWFEPRGIFETLSFSQMNKSTFLLPSFCNIVMTLVTFTHFNGLSIPIPDTKATATTTNLPVIPSRELLW